MKKELAQQLYEACPKLYRAQANKCDYIKVNLMELGICCGDGWFELLLETSNKIEVIINDLEKAGQKESSLPCAVWIREKYGYLMIIIENTTKEIEKLTNDTQDRSETICESCGKLGKMRKKDWASCLCSHCNNKHSNGVYI